LADDNVKLINKDHAESTAFEASTLHYCWLSITLLM
jgi:hypothetical protein